MLMRNQPGDYRLCPRHCRQVRDVGHRLTAGETITVTVPESVVWAVAEPVFTAGSTYWITWTPMGEKYLAVWVELEAEADEPADV